MDAILLMVIPCVGYFIAYHTYGRFIAHKIFNVRDDESVPSETCKDAKDFVPSRRGIVFGHHYTSIAGTGPIVGPAIGIIWGWVPAIIWIFVGSIAMGAVHDFGALVLSMRHEGKSIADIASRYINRRIRYILFLIVFFELLIVIAVFALIIALIFSLFPASVFPVWIQIPIAVLLGIAIYKKKVNVTGATIIAIVCMYCTVFIGQYIPFVMPQCGIVPATALWIIILLIYVFIASTLPITTLLQPRDYINAWQLIIVMVILMASIIVSGITTDIHIVAPAFNLKPKGAPPLWPFLCLTIVCGAISGFHALVSSGTSSKQIAKPRDALFIGYGAMMLEAALATLVIVAVSAGIGLAYTTGEGNILTGAAAWNTHYASWGASGGLGSKIDAVVVGSANMMATMGISKTIGIVIMGVFISSFAGTTLDSATRIQRYIISELCTSLKISVMTNRYIATLFAVCTAALLAFVTGLDGKGALTLWPVFGSVNQLLAALALILLTIYLRGRGGLKYLVTALPGLFMTIMTLWSIIFNEITFIEQRNWLLISLNTTIFILAVWMIIESMLVFMRGKKD